MFYFLYSFLRKKVKILKYCIKNNKNVYIKLDDNGRPVTCVKIVKGMFEYSKAQNILNNLPKQLRTMHFKVQAIPDITPKEEIKKIEKKIEKRDGYVVSEDISRWIDKFGACADILDEAKKRQNELIAQLHNKDKKLLDVLHIIEIERPKDLYNGWLLYRKIRDNQRERRIIKDELLIIENVLSEINPSCLQRERVQKAIDGLYTREYSFRIVDDENIEENCRNNFST